MPDSAVPGSTLPGGPAVPPPTVADRWFRTWPDSSVLDRPRLMARSLIDLADLDDRIVFYERLLGVPADLRMPIPDFGGLELAAVGNLLLIAGERPFTPVQRRTAYSLIVPSLAGQLALLERTGTSVLEPVETILPGSRARVRYPDGLLAELVEHRPRPGERPDPRPGTAVPEPVATGVRLLPRCAVPAERFADAVRFYETALEAEAETGVLPGRPDGGAGPVLVGNLLLVAHDGPAEPVAFALLAPSAAKVAELAGTGRPGRTVGGRTLMPLASGVSAEVWEGFPDPAAATGRRS
ncbi:VOC family protein [Streptomyces sp. HU2014]|uniref:VOC family protein n=1 Tax=Streptomyces sp. HU2014 TaxID=2939414 RepID=UPI00200C8AB6|nr:VOC family protein [Streptomyces sp. HU2014]UQI48254.1 VOC family protein [Streptomyces sp. HU2014]